jgi:ADP-ribosyl-[dinitrogen reductase] hydrolase
MENEIESDDLNLMEDPNIRPYGNIKIAFVWSLYYLKNAISFEEAISDIVKKGGETETNAAIVGAIIGAAEGLAAIPASMVDKVLNFKP